jgi:heptosyltransferase-2
MKPSFDQARDWERIRPRRKELLQYRYVRLRWRVLFAVIDAVGWWLRSFVERWRSESQPTASHETPVRRMLLVQLDHLGDAIITTAMLPPLRAAYPNASIEVLASSRNHPLFVACPEIDRVHVAKVNRFASWLPGLWLPAMLAWAWRLRGRRYDLGIDVRGEFPHALLLFLAGVRRRVGWNAGGGGFLLTDSPTYQPHRPETESRAALLSVLDIAPPEPITPRMTATCEEPMWPERDRRRRIVLHIGAGTPAKRWPVEHWRELLGRLLLEGDYQIALVGGPADEQRAAEILGAQPWPNVINAAGKLELARTATLLAGADLFIGADSGPAHLAAALGAPVVVLFSGTNHAAQWQPRGPRVVVVRHAVACSPCHRRHCPWAEHPCMTRIRPEQVLTAAKQLLDETSPRTIPMPRLLPTPVTTWEPEA